VSKVFAAISSESLPATNQRTAYVALTRGEEQAIVFTDNRRELLKAMCRPDDPMSATALAKGSGDAKPNGRNGRMKGLGRGAFNPGRDVRAGIVKDMSAERGLDHDR